jgi:hypothetical protein
LLNPPHGTSDANPTTPDTSSSLFYALLVLVGPEDIFPFQGSPISILGFPSTTGRGSGLKTNPKGASTAFSPSHTITLVEFSKIESILYNGQVSEGAVRFQVFPANPRNEFA